MMENIQMIMDDTIFYDIFFIVMIKRYKKKILQPLVIKQFCFYQLWNHILY